MSFREINHKNNEEYWERLELVMERIEAVSEEEASSVEELYRGYFFEMSDRKSTRLNSSHVALSRMPSSA